MGSSKSVLLTSKSRSEELTFNVAVRVLFAALLSVVSVSMVAVLLMVRVGSLLCQFGRMITVTVRDSPLLRVIPSHVRIFVPSSQEQAPYVDVAEIMVKSVSPPPGRLKSSVTTTLAAVDGPLLGQGST